MTQDNSKNSQEKELKNINWNKTVAFNGLIFVVQYIISLFTVVLLDVFDRILNSSILKSLLFIVKETYGNYDAIAIGGWIKLPLLFIITTNIIIFIFFKTSMYRLYRS
jgi:ABC-type protease/lipase transport system fused ATPase/permease subunit